MPRDEQALNACEQACNEAFQTAERTAEDDYHKCLLQGNGEAICSEQRRVALMAAEFELDRCIAECAQRWL